VQAERFNSSAQLILNTPLWEDLDLTQLSLNEEELIQLLLGQKPFQHQASFATVYSGHQFGYYVPQLGDGRALYLGEWEHQGNYTELQIKGAGRTPFSRMGDGYAVLRSSIREFLASEALHALEVPTTRALSLVHLPQHRVYRETVETGAVVCRTAESFLRFGHVQFYHHRGETAMVEALLTFVIQHYYPVLLEHAPDSKPSAEAFLALGHAVAERTASLIAKWQAVGFCHGVMNTDNMSILGLTLDYGPYGFLNAADFTHICNHSDHEGRYAYSQQPPIGLWNVLRLCDCLTPWLEIVNTSSEAYQEAIATTYERTFYREYTKAMQAKFGLTPQVKEATANATEESLTSQQNSSTSSQLIQQGLRLLHHYHVDYTRFFRRLSGLNIETETAETALTHLGLPSHAEDCLDWYQHYARYLQQEARSPEERSIAMLAVNPALVLRNHLAQEAIAAAEAGDWQPFLQVWEALRTPFEVKSYLPAHLYEAPPEGQAPVCVSCSS
jgi:uncharacterized protein YdiU (UPF0061 family)